jgi:hypothetical protein
MILRQEIAMHLVLKHGQWDLPFLHHSWIVILEAKIGITLNPNNENPKFETVTNG